MQLISRESGYNAFPLIPQNKKVIFNEVEGAWKYVSLKQWVIHKYTYL